MNNITYVLDSNIIIKLWNEGSNIFYDIVEKQKINFTIPKVVANEVSRKEYRDYNGISVLSDRFLKLLQYIREDENSNDIEKFSNTISAKKMPGGCLYYINGNKLSDTDFILLYVCKEIVDSILVTNDKRLSNVAKDFIGEDRVLNFNEWINKIGL